MTYHNCIFKYRLSPYKFKLREVGNGYKLFWIEHPRVKGQYNKYIYTTSMVEGWLATGDWYIVGKAVGEKVKRLKAICKGK